jgi:thioester reductase-like protein
MSATRGDVLLTGATGFVGMELLARYLERSDHRVIALVRADGPAGAQARVDGVLTNLFGCGAARYRDRVEAVAADMTAPDLGLTVSQRDRLAERVTTIVHSAASVSFSMGLEESREINVAGTRRMLELARLAQERGGLRCYGHISTAYVAGTHAGRFAECDLDVGQGFHNAYEQSKFEAEQLVRDAGVPFTILRPSIVVGDRTNGWTAAFNVLYWPLRAFARGLFTSVPAIPTAPVDVVSIDYVADATYALVESGRGVGHTYHLTAGAHASTMGEIAGLASRYFRRPVPKVLPPAEWAALPRGVAEASALDAGSVYFPYFSFRTTFQDEVTRARLAPDGIAASPLCDYMERLLDFATLSRWGKSPIARVDAFAA